MTQEELAERARVGLKTVQMFERGLSAPQLRSVIRIARELGMSLDAMTRTTPSPESIRANIVDGLERLEAEELEHVAAHVRALAQRKGR